MEEKNISEELMDAVANHDVKAVKACLENGADPNYIIQRWEKEPDKRHQPTTPLRMVVFRISDSLLEDSDLNTFAEIAQLLLSYGAAAKPAMELAELRYGKYDPNAKHSPFMNVLTIIENHRH